MAVTAPVPIRPATIASATLPVAARLREVGGNLVLAALFLIAALPNARHFDNDLANATWVAGAFVMAAFSLVRFPPREVAADAGALIATGAMLVLPCLMRPGARSTGLVGVAAVGIELAGVIISQAGRIWMGRRFGLLPANRGIVATGPFRIVRHPIYLGWLLLTGGYAMAFPTWRNFAIGAATAPFMMWRIVLEERVLSRDPEYRAYRASVRWRLVPGVV